MPLLARLLPAPISVDIGEGAVRGLPAFLADRRISRNQHVAVAVGAGQGERVLADIEPELDHGKVFTVTQGSVAAAAEIAREVRAGHYDALVGIGGGRTIDVAKYAAGLSGLPMVAVSTSLAHDGLASPVASLEDEDRKASYGVPVPVAVVVDLGYVLDSPPELRRSGIGDVLSNLSAVVDWRLAERERDDPVDGLAAAFAQLAGGAILRRADGIGDVDFLVALAEALILSGLAMSTAGSSRPCSGGEHEIVHAVDRLFPGTASHGELAGVATLFALMLHDRPKLMAEVSECLGRHGLPRTPTDLGLTLDDFAEAVVYAPSTRPDRYTIIEHLGLAPDQVRDRVGAFQQLMTSFA